MAALEKDQFFDSWDYLIITASNARQAEAYRDQLRIRESLGFAHGVKNTIVVADPGGRRIGSGGSTIRCLPQVLKLELGERYKKTTLSESKTWLDLFEGLRILIVHAGGDSRRLPPYGPCGKIFVPVPGEAGGAAGTTLFDRLVPTYLRLPRPRSGNGQVVVASGDVLLDFDPLSVVFAEMGVTGVGALVNPELAMGHGVFCPDETGEVRLFLQKPSITEQSAFGAINNQGLSVLDLGILNFAPEAAVRLLGLCEVGPEAPEGEALQLTGPLAREIDRVGLDIYREICCALGREATTVRYLEHVKKTGSSVAPEVLRLIYRKLRTLPFHVHIVPKFRFLHFGTLRELIESGRSLVDAENVESAMKTAIVINSRISGTGRVQGKSAWIEGCRIKAPLNLDGDNVVAGIDIEEPLALQRGMSLDILPGRSRDGHRGWFVRAYSTEDVFHLASDRGGRLCGRPLPEWLAEVGASPNDVWPKKLPAAGRLTWNGRFFPHVRTYQEYRDWLWLLEPARATQGQKARWRSARKYSLEEMAASVDLDAYHSRRLAIRSELALESLARSLGPDSEMSAAEIVYLIRKTLAGQEADWIVSMIRLAAKEARSSRDQHARISSLGLSRILHTAGSVLCDLAENGPPITAGKVIEVLAAGLTEAERQALHELGIPLGRIKKLNILAGDLRNAAFRHLGQAIVHGGGKLSPPPKNVLRTDEIAWGRAPVRLDLGGGWTDTPPYSLERGGRVINAAVDLNGQAPIQVYARIIKKPEIRINSIDHSIRLVVRTLDELLDYQKPGSKFALAKAALALSGFAPAAAAWPVKAKTLDERLRYFGGGIELTTLAAIPSGSGLGTSSIMGAVLLSIIGRMSGRILGGRELFHAVLKLEQELTTGGGWQDQIGGVIEGVKVIETDMGLIPDPRIRFVPAEMIDPAANGGQTLLYYTGLRRLAKNILREVVGRYLDRDRGAMDTLRRLHAFPPLMAEAMGMRDMDRFGKLLDVAWQLNVDLDPDHNTPVIENLRRTIRPHVVGSKLLGAGGGGFLLMACKSHDDALAIRRILDTHPPNDEARFFDYSVSRTGLVVTVC